MQARINISANSASSTDSISSSIRHYREVHGRTFHNFGDTEYWYEPGMEVQRPIANSDQGDQMMKQPTNFLTLGLFVKNQLGNLTPLNICRHHMYTLLLGNKLYLAPLERNIQQALDIGTGTVSTAFHPRARFCQEKCLLNFQSTNSTELLGTFSHGSFEVLYLNVRLIDG